MEANNKHGPLIGIFEGFSGWNVVLLLVMIIGFTVQNSKFTTHVEETLIKNSDKVKELRTTVAEIHKNLSKITIDIARLQSKVDHMREDTDYVSDKLDKIRNGK